MYEVSDEDGNSFYTNNYDLALLIAKDKTNPFINIVKLNDKVKVDKDHIIEDMEDFLTYFF